MYSIAAQVGPLIQYMALVQKCMTHFGLQNPTTDVLSTFNTYQCLNRLRAQQIKSYSEM